MSFQYLLYVKLDRSEENVFWYSHNFIIFKALIPEVATLVDLEVATLVD